MSLTNTDDIKRPILDKNFKLNKNNNDINIFVMDYYRCLDTLDYEPPIDENEESIDDGDDDNNADENLFSEEKQKELSYTQPMLIKAFGMLESRHSITINLKGFQPFFYICIPDEWSKIHYNAFVAALKKAVYYKFKDHLVKAQMVLRKPFSKFTGKDQFKFLKLYFKNKESYDTYVRKLSKPLIIKGLMENKPHKYDLYEANIEPILKFIHLTKIKPVSWIQLPKDTYQITKGNKKTVTTDYEVTLQWDQIKPLDKFGNAPLNILSFDIEANSSHGDFPVAKKTYQKLAQDLITLYNEYGIKGKRNNVHPLLKSAPKSVINNLMNLVFNDYYNNNGIHQINTISNLKPHAETIEQLSYAICQLFELIEQKHLTIDEFVLQLTDLFEYNLPPLDIHKTNNSDYFLLATEITSQMSLLKKSNNKRYLENPQAVVTLMIQMAFDEYLDAFNVNCVYTKKNIKPDPKIIASIVPFIYSILSDCANFIHKKKIPANCNFTTVDGTEYTQDNLTQTAFVKLLTDLLNQYLPPVEGDPVTHIGSTFQLMGESDCYLKHIICLNTCDSITNDELVNDENADIYLPAKDLAKDLIAYEKQLGNPEYINLTKEQTDSLLKTKEKEIKGWDIPYRKLQCKKAAEYRRAKQSLTDKAIVIVECFDTEREVLLAWKQLVIINDPEIVAGYNINLFDFSFMGDRADENGCAEEFYQLGRMKGLIQRIFEQKLSSSGLGDNILKYIPMVGRAIIDVYKHVQASYKLDSYKLDSVCHKFLFKEKMDMPPQELFILNRGSSADRKKIAEYCLIDCVLNGRLISKLEIVGNAIAMANVCKVPFTYLFLRGQGVKIFSLVADVCADEGFLIPTLAKADPDSDEGYEGALVLNPFTGIYFDPIAVADFNSLYPSSMISENLSHDSFVEIGGKYDNLPGYEYVDIKYDKFKTTVKPGTKKKIKVKIGVETCRYVQLVNGKKGILPTILMNLLKARKEAKNKAAAETDPFKAKIWDGLQLAYKVTANSLYGQTGASTSPICKKEIAASTTAIGRQMIMFSKNYVEKEYKDKIIILDTGKAVTPYSGKKYHIKDTYCVYGDTDSIFIKFGIHDMEGNKIGGIDAVFISMALCKMAAKEISVQLKPPQNLDPEKVIYPFVLVSKKRYHGHYYTDITKNEFYPNSMGLLNKRRDNAPIAKHVFGGSLDIIMNQHDVAKAKEFVENETTKLLNGEFSLDKFTITKTLRSYYAKPNQIAHNVLANRQAQRDPGNKFESNDRVPYVFIIHPNPSKDHLQGDKIETPAFIKQNNLMVNYKMYLTNQIMKPVAQIFDLVPGFEGTETMLNGLITDQEYKRQGIVKLDKFIKKKTTPDFPKLFDMIEKARLTKEALAKQDVQIIDADDEDEDPLIEDDDELITIEGADAYESNYDNPDF